MRKKLLAYSLCALLALSLTGCQKNNGKEKFVLSTENAGEYIVSMGQYEGLTVTANRDGSYSEDDLDYVSEMMFANECAGIDSWQAQNGYTLDIDYVGKINGVAFDGGSAQGETFTIGTDHYIDGFAEGLIGAKKGDVLDLNLTFPEDFYAEQYAGKDVVFTITVNNVIPPLTDEAVSALGSTAYSTVNEFKVFAAEAIEEYNNEVYEENIIEALMEKVVDSTSFAEKLPEGLLEEAKNNVEETFADMAAYYGITVDKYIEMCGSSMETVQDIFAKRKLVYYKIAAEKELAPTEEELEAYVDEMVELYGANSRDEFFVGVMSKEQCYEVLLGDKVCDYLLTVTTAIEE